MAWPGVAWRGEARLGTAREVYVKNGKLYFGGLPIAPELERLKRAFPTVSRGDVIPYERIAGVLGLKWTERRFRTVVTAWRKALFRDLSLDTMAAGGAVRVLLPMQQEGESRRDIRFSVRKLRRGVVRVEAIETQTLTEDELARVEHTRRLSEVMLSAAAKGARELARVKPIEALPRGEK